MKRILLSAALACACTQEVEVKAPIAEGNSFVEEQVAPDNLELDALKLDDELKKDRGDLSIDLGFSSSSVIASKYGPSIELLSDGEIHFYSKEGENVLTIKEDGMLEFPEKLIKDKDTKTFIESLGALKDLVAQSIRPNGMDEYCEKNRK